MQSQHPFPALEWVQERSQGPSLLPTVPSTQTVGVPLGSGVRMGLGSGMGPGHPTVMTTARDLGVVGVWLVCVSGGPTGLPPTVPSLLLCPGWGAPRIGAPGSDPNARFHGSARGGLSPVQPPLVSPQGPSSDSGYTL